VGYTVIPGAQEIWEEKKAGTVGRGRRLERNSSGMHTEINNSLSECKGENLCVHGLQIVSIKKGVERQIVSLST